MNTTSEPIANPTTATPVEIDTRLAELDTDHYRLTGRQAVVLGDVHSLNGERSKYLSRTRKAWPTTDAEALAELTAKLAAGTLVFHYEDQARRALAIVTELAAKVEANRAEFASLETEYERRPWRRYIGVLGGHIHSGYRCVGGTIRVTTQITWQPQLSGKEVADAVAELGPLLCTHCFPDAPVEWQAGRPKPERCAGSGLPEVTGTFRRQGMSGYGQCQECKTNQTVTSGGAIRAHKPKKD